MQPVGHQDLQQPLTIHLEPEEALNSPVTVEFSVEKVPCLSEPKVSCYKSNGCIVFEGYCPIDSEIPFSQCGIRNDNTNSKQQQDIALSQEPKETEAPYNPFEHWDIIPRLMHAIIHGTDLKGQSMADKKLSSGVGNMRDKPEKPSGRGSQRESDSVVDGVNLWDEMTKMHEQMTHYSKRDRPTLIYPRIGERREISGDSSDDMSCSNDPFEKKKWQTVGNIANPNTPVSKPVVIDKIQARSSEALVDAADLVTQRKWERRAAHHTKVTPPLLQKQLGVPERAPIPKEDRVSTVLAAYTKSVPLQSRLEEGRIIKDLKDLEDNVSVSISETNTGDIEVDLSETDASNSTGSSEGVISLADAACGTGRIDREASQCILCGSPLQHRQQHHQHHAKSAYTTGKTSKEKMDVSTQASCAGHRKHKEEKTVKEKETTAGHRKRSEENTVKQKDTTAGHRKRSEENTVKQKDTTYPVAASQGQQPMATMEVSTQSSSAGHKKRSKEKTMRQEVTAYSVATDEEKPSRGLKSAPTYALVAEYEQQPKEKRSRHEITAYPVYTSPSGPLGVTMDAGTSNEEETQNSGQSYIAEPDKSGHDQNVAAYPLSRNSSSIFKRSSKRIDSSQCTMQHILFPKDNCPYSPSLTSLPLDASDIEYIIRRAQLAKASLPADESLCPMERWQLRSHQRHSSRSSRSRSSG